MQSKAATIADYLKTLSPDERAVISTLDKLIRKTSKAAVGTMKYGMPTYEVAGLFIATNAQKNYFSFYANPPFVKKFKAELKGLDCGKSCIRFRKLTPELVGTFSRIIAEYGK
jgi:uncharacterized protein YdhG (YjbR/CyaY superfamily)